MIDKYTFSITAEMGTCKQAYKTYKDWCAQHGHKPESYNRFRQWVLNKRKNKK